jgi:hypothetical protein
MGKKLFFALFFRFFKRVAGNAKPQLGGLPSMIDIAELGLGVPGYLLIARLNSLVASK